MKKSDKNMYSIIKILGTTEIVLLSYFIIFLIINLIDSGEISIVLINKLFDILYSITLFINICYGSSSFYKKICKF